MLTSSPTPYPPTGSTLNDTGKLDVTVTPGLQFSNDAVSNRNVPPRVPYVRLFEVTWPVKAMSSQVARPPNAIGLNLPTPGVPTSWLNAEAAGATARTSATATAAAPSRFIVMTLPGWVHCATARAPPAVRCGWILGPTRQIRWAATRRHQSAASHGVTSRVF